MISLIFINEVAGYVFSSCNLFMKLVSQIYFLLENVKLEAYRLHMIIYSIMSFTYVSRRWGLALFRIAV